MPVHDLLYIRRHSNVLNHLIVSNLELLMTLNHSNLSEANRLQRSSLILSMLQKKNKTKKW